MGESSEMYGNTVFHAVDNVINRPCASWWKRIMATLYRCKTLYIHIHKTWKFKSNQHKRTTRTLVLHADFSFFMPTHILFSFMFGIRIHLECCWSSENVQELPFKLYLINSFSAVAFLRIWPFLINFIFLTITVHTKLSFSCSCSYWMNFTTTRYLFNWSVSIVFASKASILD